MTTTLPDPETSGAPERESGRHPVEVGYLVMGIALLGMVAAWALIVGDVIEGDDVRWLLPMPWVLGGAAGLAALALRGRERRRPATTATTTATTTTAATTDTDTATTTETTDTRNATEEDR